MQPGYGAFLSKDPFEGVLQRVMSRNGYSYVEGNPINHADPSGKFIQVLLPFALGGLIGAATSGFVAGRTWDMAHAGECGCAK